MENGQTVSRRIESCRKLQHWLAITFERAFYPKSFCRLVLGRAAAGSPESAGTGNASGAPDATLGAAQWWHSLAFDVGRARLCWFSRRRLLFDLFDGMQADHRARITYPRQIQDGFVGGTLIPA